jgi:lauroyl/myristoyl acyltransferase
MEASSRAPSVPFRLSDLVHFLYPIVPLRLLVAMAKLQGRLIARLRPRSARAVEENLASVMRYAGHGGDPRASTIRFFEGEQVRLLLLHATQRMSREELEELIPLSGLHHLDVAVAGGKGTVLLLSHLNSLGGFLVVMLLRKMGYDVRVAIPEDRDPYTPSWFRRAIYAAERHEPESILESLGAFFCQFNIRPIVRALRENAVVVQTGDGTHSASFVDVDFLGRRIPFTNAIMNVARSTGSMVVPVFLVGEPPDMTAVIEPPFTISDRAELDERVAAYASRLEGYLVQRPETWLGFRTPNALDGMIASAKRPLQDRYEM